MVKDSNSVKQQGGEREKAGNIDNYVSILQCLFSGSFSFKRKKSSSSRQVQLSVPFSLSLCVCESDWVLQHAFHGEKEGGNKRRLKEKRREHGRETHKFRERWRKCNWKPGAVVFVYFIRISCCGAAEKGAVKTHEGQDGRKARQMGRRGSYHHRVSLTTNTQWAENSDGKKMACVVPLCRCLRVVSCHLCKRVFSFTSASIRKS